MNGMLSQPAKKWLAQYLNFQSLPPILAFILFFPSHAETRALDKNVRLKKCRSRTKAADVRRVRICSRLRPESKRGPPLPTETTMAHVPSSSLPI